MTTFPDEVWLDEHGCLWRSLSPWASDVLILAAPRGDGTWTHPPYEIIHPDGFHKAHPNAVQLVRKINADTRPPAAPAILDSDPDGPNP